MKKLSLSLFVIISFVFYAINERAKSSAVMGETFPDNSTGTQADPPQNPIGQFNSRSMGHGQMMGMMTDGQFSGDIVDAYYGNVQVQITVNGGKITDVQFLDYPKDRRTSIYINSQAMPILKNEAIRVQSANVNIVTGATATSRAFIQSIQSAITRSQS